jgi:ATP-dependent Clp protease ATP-binding subunit ClpA
MYERFTDRARKVMQLANEEAQRFHHEYIGTEHILLGLVREGAGVAANVLKNLAVDLHRIHLEVEKIVMPGPDLVGYPGRLPQTPRAKKVIEYAIEEARKLNHQWVGTEHLLLGLLRAEEGVAAQILMNFGLTLTDAREEVLCLLGHPLNPAPRERPNVEVLELPPDVSQNLKELEEEIYRFQVEMEAAIVEQDFERAAEIRDQADRIRQTRQALHRQWRREYAIDPSWLRWNDGTVVKIARVIDQERRWQELPILADALEEAGCTDQVILGHCRQPGEHSSGCWVIDLLLDKE